MSSCDGGSAGWCLRYHPLVSSYELLTEHQQYKQSEP